MKKFLFLLMLLPVMGYGQYYKYDYFKTIDKRVVFEANYKSSDDKDILIKDVNALLASKSYVKNIQIKDNAISFEIIGYSVNYNKYSDYFTNGAPIILTQKQSGYGIITVTDNGYQLKIKDMISGKDEVPVTYEKYLNKGKYFSTDRKYKVAHCIEESYYDEFKIK